MVPTVFLMFEEIYIPENPQNPQLYRKESNNILIKGD